MSDHLLNFNLEEVISSKDEDGELVFLAKTSQLAKRLVRRAVHVAQLGRKLGTKCTGNQTWRPNPADPTKHRPKIIYDDWDPVNCPQWITDEIDAVVAECERKAAMSWSEWICSGEFLWDGAAAIRPR